MRLLSHYLTREYLKLLGLMLVGCVGIFMVFDFIEKIDNFNEAGVDAARIAAYFLLEIPEVVVQMAPMAVLISAVITLGLMSKRGEIIAVKASGISLIRFTLPVVLCSAVVAVGVAVMEESVLPLTRPRTSYIWEVLVEKRPGRMVHRRDFWYRGRGGIYHVDFYEPATRSLVGVSYYRIGKGFRLVGRIDAKRAVWREGVWIFEQGLEQKALADGGLVAHRFKQLVISLPERPEDFTQMSTPTQQMDIASLAEYARTLEADGYDATRYWVDLHFRISYPFVCVIVGLLGVGLGLARERGAFMAPGLLVGIALAISYWVSVSYTKALLGYSGLLPPLVAAWLPNVFFALVGLGLLASIRQ